MTVPTASWIPTLFFLFFLKKLCKFWKKIKIELSKLQCLIFFIVYYFQRQLSMNILRVFWISRSFHDGQKFHCEIIVKKFHDDFSFSRCNARWNRKIVVKKVSFFVNFVISNTKNFAFLNQFLRKNKNFIFIFTGAVKGA